MALLSTESAEAPPAAPVMLGGAVARFSSRRAYAQTFAAAVAIRCLGAASGILAARLLGPEGRGELAVMVFLPMLLMAVGELEVGRSIAFEASRLDRLSGKFLATSFWLALGLGTVQAAVLAVALPHYLPADKLHLLSAARWFVVYLPAAYITAALTGSDQGRGYFGRFSFLLALPGALYVLGILAAWGGGRVTPATFAFGLLLATLVTAAVRVSIDGRGILVSVPDWALARRLLKRGFSYYVPAVAGMLLARADMFIVVRLAPVSTVGLYAIAQAIALGQIGMVNPFIQVGFSAVAGEADAQQALQTLARHFRFAQAAVLTVGLLAAAATPWLVGVVFGERFVGAIATAYLLIGSTVLWGMEQVLEQGLRAASHPRPGIFSNLLGLCVLVGLGVPACLLFGISGLATALLGAQLVNLLVLIGFCAFALGMPLRSLWAFDADNLREFRGAAVLLMRRVGVVARA